MFLTRLGEGSKMVVTGDLTQTDLPDGKSSGLKHAVGVLKGTESSVMPVIPQAQAVLIEKGKTGEVVQEFDLAATVQAPVEKGQLLGRVYFKLNGETLYTYDLLSDREIPALTFFESFKRILLSLCT